MNKTKFLYLESMLMPDYFIVIDTINKAMLRIIHNGWQLNVTISFDKQRIFDLTQPYNCCNSLTRSELITRIAKGFTKEQIETIDGLIKQLGC